MQARSIRPPLARLAGAALLAGLLAAAGCARAPRGAPPGCPLEARRAEHPRLYLDAPRLAALRGELRGSHAGIWTQVLAWVESRSGDAPPARLEGDFRRAGELVPYAALAGLLAEEPRYVELARRFMRSLAAQPRWGDDRDIEAAHLLYALAVGYDWLHAQLDPAEREALRAKLLLQGARLRPACAGTHPPLNNHTVVKLAALGTAALALYPEPAADAWLAFVNGEFARILPYFGSDGLSCEGISYWSYSTEYLLKYFTAADALLGTRFLDNAWIRRAADAPLHLALPRAAWSATNLFVNLADSPRFCWYGPHYQLFKLAALARDPEAQWLAQEIQRSGFTRHHADWLSLLWYDPTLAPRAPDGLPLARIFADWDVAALRSGWDDGATLCTFTCGAVGGRQLGTLRSPVYPGSGHLQPDANSFTLFAAGEWLAAAPGATRVKRTAHHNTILVNGRGQLGEGGRWLDAEALFRQKRRPRIVWQEGDAGHAYLVGDAAAAYPRESRVTRFLRHFIYLRPDLVIVADELAAESDSGFEWLLHTPGTIAVSGPRRAEIRSGEARLLADVVLPEDASIDAREQAIEAEYPGQDWQKLNLLTLKPRRAARSACFVVVLGAGREGTALETRAAVSGEELILDIDHGAAHRRVVLAGLGRPRASPSVLTEIADAAP